jgi:multiple sugar transport system substrate-binding protein
MGGDWMTDKIKPVIAAFEKIHPNITVNYQPVAFDDMTPKVQSTVGQGQSTPDLYQVDQPRVPGWAKGGLLTDLTDKVPDLSSQVFADALTQSSFNGRLYSLPTGESTGMVLYNSDLLTKAGVTLPSSDVSGRWTWEQLEDAAKKAQAAGAKYGILWDAANYYYEMEALPVSMGGGTGLTGTDNLTPDITNPGWVKAMTWYGGLFSQKITPRGLDLSTVYDLFGNGQAAFLVTGPWAPALISNHKINMGLMPEPYFAAGKPVTPSGSFSTGINPHSQNQDAALIFTEWMALDPPGNSQYVVANQESSSLLVNANAPFTTEPYQWWPDSAKIGDLITKELTTTAVPRPRSVGYPQFESIMTTAFTDISNGTDPTAALQKATASLNAAFASLK